MLSKRYVYEELSQLGVAVNSAMNYFRGHFEEKAKLASKKLGVLSREGQYFLPAQRLQFYKAQVRPHMEYCSHLWAGARAAGIFDDRVLSDRPESLALRRHVASL
ncbi:unnamed protein product [Parnassius mnemosyne]|uniref:Uncharacterized protein n=1 Tax=Parnassius mnemosyne TaxID=213953 RepID=A0AAV1LY96_9NEOP